MKIRHLGAITLAGSLALFASIAATAQNAPPAPGGGLYGGMRPARIGGLL
jgi:hypothetical protein